MKRFIIDTERLTGMHRAFFEIARGLGLGYELGDYSSCNVRLDATRFYPVMVDIIEDGGVLYMDGQVTDERTYMVGFFDVSPADIRDERNVEIVNRMVRHAADFMKELLAWRAGDGTRVEIAGDRVQYGVVLEKFDVKLTGIMLTLVLRTPGECFY